MTQFHAQPYSIEHTGFYFDSIDAFQEGMEKLNKRGCEEVEIQFIDGDDYLADLARAINIGQGDIDRWYEELENLDETATTQICFLMGDLGYNLSDALERFEEVCLYEGKAEDYAYDLYEDCYDIPEHLRLYIDYEAIARDLKINGDINEIRYDLIVTNANEF
ncbi:MAG: antirestriction protein ArdA [Candidatus Thiodiazotropha endolucinida]